jgi:methionyl-tRNA formyltransferase
LSVACGEGVLRLLRLQRPGRAALEASAFLRGFPIPPGTILPCPATS